MDYIVKTNIAGCPRYWQALSCIIIVLAFFIFIFYFLSYVLRAAVCVFFASRHCCTINSAYLSVVCLEPLWLLPMALSFESSIGYTL